MKQYFLFAIMALGLVFTACKKEDEPNIKNGKLSGSSWVYNYQFSGSAGANDYTYTFKFTSDKGGTTTQTGWYQVVDAKTWKMQPKQNVNKSQDFTYTYSKELKKGVFTCPSGGVFTKGDHIFEITDDFNKLKIGNTTYNRK